MYNYENIKEIAKENKRSVKDYLVLSPTNDPFYVGSEGQIAKARWFGEIYKKMGSPEQCHIRRIHYWLVSQKPKYLKPGKESFADIRDKAQKDLDNKKISEFEFENKMKDIVYLNTQNDWSYIVMCAKYARYLGIIPMDNMIDKRNPAPIVNAEFWENESPTEVKDETDAEAIIQDIVKRFYCFNPHNTQKYMIELWCEKSTMNDILEPIARRHGLNFITGLGELSITAVNLLIKRIAESEKPVRIFYISDFDPAGECMPVSVARKIEFLMQDEGLDNDVKLKQIVLTKEQCREFELPRTPIKKTEKRKAGFEDKYGAGATELDALEAVHPGTLKKIIETAVFPYFNFEGWRKSTKLNMKVRNKVNEFLKGKIGDVLEELDLSEYEEPEFEEGEEIEDYEEDWIFDSELDYFDQLINYKRFKGG